MTDEFDVFILGTGPSASRIATKCAERLRVAIADSREIGGECALRGCNPKKVLVRAAELVDWTRRSSGKLIAPCYARIDWTQLIEFKRTFTRPVPSATKESFRQKGIVVLEGAARFTGPKSVAVGDRNITAQQIVVCTGASPAKLGIRGEELLTHSDAFMDLNELPRRILFVGGGYISFEFAHVARRAGAEVTIMDRNARPLAGFDADLVEKLVDASRVLGIRFHLDSEVQAVEQLNGDQLCVHAIQNGVRAKFTADLVVHGAGRVPSVESLDLAAAQVETDANGILVNEYMQSVSNPHVYAAGDVASTKQPKITPVANQQGRTVALNLLEGNRHTPDYGAVPRVVFTVPSLAAVGMTENQARAEGRQFDVHADTMADWTSLRKVAADHAAYKLLIEKGSGRILGAHLLAPDAAETINLFALAMRFNLTATDIKSTLFAFPTFAADVRSMVPDY